MTKEITIYAVIFKILLSIIVGGLIGIEREYKNRPAGMRTHILVSVGATIIALIQITIAQSATEAVIDYPSLASATTIDQSRLIAQIVSGIGFLGAGTIIVNRKSITGLTTAASLWVGAALGIAIGMGYYNIALVGCVAVLVSLTLVHKILRVNTLKKLEIKYVHRQETKEFLVDYFKSKKIDAEIVNFNASFEQNYRIYSKTYNINLPKNMTYTEVIEDLSSHENIMKLSIVSV